MFLDSKTGRSVILRYILTGMGGFSLGAVVGILFSIIASFSSLISIDSETIILIIVITISSIGTSSFGIVSKDIKKTLHYGAAGTSLGILTYYCLMSLELNYYIPLLILPAWGFVIGLPGLKSAVISAVVGLVAGIFIGLFFFMIINLPFQSPILSVLIPFLAFFSLLMVGTVIGLTVYEAEKIKESKVYFNDMLLAAILIKGMVFLIIAVIILTTILAFISAMSEKPRDVIMTYQIHISGNDEEQYSVYFPSLVQGINASEMLESAILSGNGTYYATENITSIRGERIRALAISGRGNLTFKASRKNDIQFGPPTNEIEVYFQGKNGSVIIRMEGYTSGSESYVITFNTEDTRMIEGWQNVSEILFQSTLE